MRRERPPGRPRSVVRWIRRRMDALELAVQRRSVLSTLARRVRGVMHGFVVRFLPGAIRRPELDQARVVMADAPSQPATGPKVLFMTFRAWTSHVAWETTIAQALRLRGARCEFFYCGGGLPICEIGWPATDDPPPCERCGGYVAGMIDAARFPRHSLDDLVPADERRAIEAEVRAALAGDSPGTFRGRALDPLVETSLVAFFRTGTLPDTDEVARARDDFRVGAAIMTAAAPRLLDEVQPEVVVLVNGLFYEDRIVREEALARGVRVVTYEVGAQAGTLFFADDRPAPDYDISEVWERAGDRPLTEEDDRALEAVLRARRSGAGLARRYYVRRRGLTTRRAAPVVAVFTNVTWDTAVIGEQFAFASTFEWMAATVRIAEQHPELDFVIRVHPSESRWRGMESHDRSSDFVRRALSPLPGNVRLVPPEEALDSYALLDAADVVAVFSSTVGLEAAAAGKPVCVAGKAHYRGRGFTTDVTSPEGYAALFDDRLWTAPDPERPARARRYAFLFFCRAMIPFPAVVEEEPAEPVFTFARVAELARGNDPYLDLVCDGILGRGPLRLT